LLLKTKMENKPLLTFAIPTYNRSETLEEILKELEKQNTDEVIILVSDDTSPDNTQEMVSGYKDRIPNLIYNRNEKNLGFNGNVCTCYELAPTRYVWFFCDDDTLLPGAINSVVTALKKYEPVVTVFNHTQMDPYGVKVTAGVSQDIIYNSVDEIKDYQSLQRTTFLSILVVEKRLPLDVIKRENYMDNIYFQVTLSLLLLSDKFKFAEISSLVLHRNVGYKYGEFFKFYMVDHLKAVTIIPHKMDVNKFVSWSKGHLFTALKLYLSRKLGLFLYKGNPTTDTLKALFKFYRFTCIVILMFPIIYFLTPAFVLKGIYFLQLMRIHGYNDAKVVYNRTINRAFTDERRTGFTSYR